MMNLSTEERFVRSCVAAQVRTRRSNAGLESWNCQNVEMPSVREIAVRHDVVPNVGQALENQDHAIPNQQSFEELRQSVVQRNLLLTRELHQIIDRFDQAEIPIIPYKGPVLAQDGYGSVTSRQFGDLDCLVPADRVEAARELLQQHGFEVRHTDLQPTERSSFRKTEYHYVLVDEHERYEVELHWRVAPGRFPYSFDYEAMFERAGSTKVAGKRVPRLSREDRLLVLSVHGTSHRWSRLKWIADIAAILDQERIDGGTVLKRARQIGIESALLLGVVLSQDVLNTPIPEPLRTAAENNIQVTRLAEEARSNLFAAEPSTFQRQRFAARARDRRRDSLRHYGLAVFLPAVEDFERWNLPEPLFPLYYLLRPIRLAARGVNRAITNR